MRNIVDEQKGALCELGCILKGIEMFLVGPTPEEKDDVKNPECLNDALKMNSVFIKDSLEIARRIKQILEGER